MSKDALERLSDTASFVRRRIGRPGFPISVYEDVIEALGSRLNAMSPPKKVTLSGFLSLEKAGRFRPKDENERRIVRAAILLDLALVFPESGWAQQAKDQINLGSQGAWGAFDAALGRARDAVYSEPGFLDVMLSELRAHPLRVLRKHLITLDGGNKDGNPLTYRVWYQGGGYRLSCYGTGNGYTLKALNVKATAYKDVKDAPGALDPVNSADGGGADLLFTTQFTGCSFCFMKNGDGTNIRAAHIDPGKGEDAPSGAELSKTMREGGGFSDGNGGDFKVYGRVPDKSGLPGYPESAGSMTIVGVRKGTEWRLYSQIKGLDGSIVSAQRIDTIANAAEFR